MRVLITGGAGFIGSAVCRHLVGAGAEVLNVDKLTYAANLHSLAAISDNPRYRFLRADICDAAAMAGAFAEFRPDAIMHLAAESHVDRSIDAPAGFVLTNVVGTSVLLGCARDYWMRLSGTDRDRFRFLHVSTDEVFGSLGAEGYFTEKSAYDPSSPYSASKAASDHLVTAWHRTYGLPVLITNCSNNYGPCQFPEKLIPLAILNALEDRPITVYGTGQNVRDWLYVEDHAAALVLILERGRVGETYNVGGRAEFTNLTVARMICACLDRSKPAGRSHRRLITLVADRPGHDLRYAIDPAKIETELGWRAQESFLSGLEKTVRWYLDNPDWWRPARSAIYSGERLGQGQARPSPKPRSSGGAASAAE